jgi:ATP-dependent RNA helicase RhlE
MAISFCDAAERAYLKDIEKLIDNKITVVHDHPFINDNLENASFQPERKHGHKRKPKPASKSQGGGGKNNYWRKRKTGGPRKPS